MFRILIPETGRLHWFYYVSRLDPRSIANAWRIRPGRAFPCQPPTWRRSEAVLRGASDTSRGLTDSPHLTCRAAANADRAESPKQPSLPARLSAACRATGHVDPTEQTWTNDQQSASGKQCQEGEKRSHASRHIDTISRIQQTELTPAQPGKVEHDDAPHPHRDCHGKAPRPSAHWSVPISRSMRMRDAAGIRNLGFPYAVGRR